jgi:hypothetical protein
MKDKELNLEEVEFLSHTRWIGGSQRRGGERRGCGWYSDV